MSKLDDLMKDINKKFKDEIMVKGVKWEKVDIKIPFSSPRANYMTYGGIPLGRAVQFFGEKNGGKTTTSLDIVANAQKLFKKQSEETGQPEKEVLFIDAENTLDEEWATTLGVDLDSLRLLRPHAQSAEDLFQIIIEAVETGEVGLIILDSVGVLLSNAAWEANMDERTYCGIAGPLTVFTGKITPLLHRYHCTLIYINQVRDVINAKFPMQSTPGGRALAHSLSLNIKFQKGSFIDSLGAELKSNAENPDGNLVMMSIEKTKVCRPDRRTGFYTLNYREGIDKVNDLVDLCIKQGIIEQAGAWYTVNNWTKLIETGEVVPALQQDGEIMKFQGRSKLVEFFKENEELSKELNDTLLKLLNEEK